MVRVEGHRIIRAPVQKVFQLVSRLDSSSRVTGLWLTADLLDRKANTLTVHYRGYFAGMPVESIQLATLFPPNRIDFRQSRGGLKTFRGQYQFKPIEEDTDLSLSVEADAGIPLISEQATRLVLHSFIERSLEKYKLTAERELPRAPRRAAEEETKEAPSEPPAAEVQPAVASEQTPPAPQPSGPKRRRRRRRRRRQSSRSTGSTESAESSGS